jgi:hypothetical protein
MSTPELKERLTQLINSTDDEELLNEIYEMVSQDNTSVKLTEVQKKQIIKAKSEIRNGQFARHDEVKKRTSEWLSKD